MKIRLNERHKHFTLLRFFHNQTFSECFERFLLTQSSIFPLSYHFFLLLANDLHFILMCAVYHNCLYSVMSSYFTSRVKRKSEIENTNTIEY